MSQHYKVIAVYQLPETEEKQKEIENYFQEVHTPLCLKIPGMKELRVNKVFSGPTGQSSLHQIVEMVFENKESWKAAMKTPEMMNSGKDAHSFAGSLVSVHFASENIIMA